MSTAVLRDVVVERHDAVCAQRSLAERVRARREFRVAGQKADENYDALLGGATSAVRKETGVLFDILREAELYDPFYDGRETQRTETGALAMPRFGTPQQRLENRGRASVHVHSQHQWDARIGAPHNNSLLDERMGPIRESDIRGNKVLCEVCGGVLQNDHYCAPRAHEPGLCDGHFGVIVLPGAVWHPMAVAVVCSVLNAMCWHCGSLPSTSERCAAVVRQMRAKCETRVERLKFLAHRFKNRRSCLACHARHRCGARDPGTGEVVCGAGTAQCVECSTLVHFRPALRTDKQLQNSVRALQRAVVERHDGELGATAEARETLYAEANRGHQTTGFPCEALLDGNVRAGRARENDAYERFATMRYGAQRGNNRLVMHGERVRAVLQQAAPDFLSLLRDDTLESCDDVLDWLLSLVPRVLPVPPNCVRPTEIKTEMVGRDDIGQIQLHDMTKRYQQIVRRVHKMSAAIDTMRRQRATELSGPIATLYADLRRSERDTWYRNSLGDFRLIDVYGEIQYYYAAIISNKLAPKFLPTRARSHGVGRSAALSAARKSAAKSAPDGGGSDSGGAKSFAKILHGKPGRVRWNLMGKRVEFSARSVIVPDHNISVRDVLLPAEIAARISVPERVHSLNAHDVVTRAERIRTLGVERRTHDGCAGCAQCEPIALNERSDLCIFTAARDQRVRYNDGTLAQPIAEHQFVHEAGAIVERPLRTGDYVVMNRQPTLHRQSMMAHRVRVLEPSASGGRVNAIRLHELVTDPYNADFDGDEMNVHRPQGVAADTEMRTLMSVAQNLISSRDATPCLGLKQDAATGLYILTSRDTFLERHAVCSILMFAVREHGLRLPQPAVRVWREARGCWLELWTGAQVASFALPGRLGGGANSDDSLLQYRRPERFALDAQRLDYPAGGVTNETVLPFVVIDSEIVFGRVDKRVAGAKHGALQHVIAMRAGVPAERALNEACDFIDRCSWLASAFLTLRGFSVGLQDCMFGAHQRDAAREIRRAARGVHARVDRLLAGKTEESRALLHVDHYSDRVTEVEKRISAIADNVFDRTASMVGRCIGPNNAFHLMLRSGGKGKVLNMGQIMGCVGQQRLGGERVINVSVAPYDNDAKTAGGSRAEGGRENTTGGAGVKKSRDRAPGGLARLDGEALMRVLDCSMYRLSPHVPRGAYPGAAAGGFIDRSFIEGLTPSQFFHHAQGGREGLVDTAIKTAQTGYLQRKAMKSCEALTVRYDRTVRDATNQIVSVRFGDNALDTRSLVRKQLRFIGMSRAQLAAALFYDESDTADEWWAARVAGAQHAAVLERERDALRAALVFLRTAAARAGSDCDVATPNSLEAIVVDVVREAQRGATGSPAARQRAFCGQDLWSEDDERVRDAALRGSASPEFGEPSAAQRARCRAAPQLEPLRNAVEAAQLLEGRLERWRDTLRVLDHLTECELRLRLCSKQVLRRYELSRSELERVLELYEDVLLRAQIQAGESVGAEMVTAIGQPATQMTLNTFHIAGSVGAAVAGGTQRMSEISEATRPDSMEGIKVTMPLHDELFALRAQRQIGAALLVQLLAPERRRALQLGGGTYASHVALREALCNHAQVVHCARAEQARLDAARAVALSSVATSDVERALRRAQRRWATDALFECVDACFDANGGVPTLGGATAGWRVVECAVLATATRRILDSRGWSSDARRFFAACGVRTALVADIAADSPWLLRAAEREHFCEAVWRAALPLFGGDAPFTVFARCSTTQLLSVAIVARGVRTEYAEALYNAVRVERDCLALEFAPRAAAAADGGTPLPPLRAAVLADARHRRPQSVVNSVRSVAESDATPEALEQKIERALLDTKQVERGNAHARHLYKNIVATSVLDFTECVSIAYEPIVEGAPEADGTPTYAVRFSEDEALSANDSERIVCEMHYEPNCFDRVDPIGCRRDDCLRARRDPADERCAQARVGCLGSWVLALRIDPNWFVRNDILPSVLECSLARALGPSYQVLVGDMNSERYVALRVRVFACCVRDELHVLNDAELRNLDNFAPPRRERASAAADDDGDVPLDARGVPLVPHNPQATDAENAALERRTHNLLERRVRNDELTVLDRVKWLVLHHRLCGPASGSIVMCERKRQALFTDERGLEHVRRHVIVSDSSDLYHLLGLRGVDVRCVRTNSLHDVCAMFGIEACRAALIDEYDEMMEAGGSFVNRAHYALRADMQTRYGALHPLTINGLLAAPHDPIQAASHEQAAAHFFDAALKKRGALPLASPSASVALGQPLVHQGTGAIDVLMDMDALVDPARYCFEQPEPTVIIGGMQQRAAADLREQLVAIGRDTWDDGVGSRSPEHASFVDDYDEHEPETAEARAERAHYLWERDSDAPMARFSPGGSEDEAEPSESEEDEQCVRTLNDQAVLQMHTDEAARRVGPSSEFIDAFGKMAIKARGVLAARVKRARGASEAEEYDPVKETQRVALRDEVCAIARSALEYDPTQPAMGSRDALQAVQAASPSALGALAQKLAGVRGNDDDSASSSSLASEDFSEDFMGASTAFGLF